MSSVVPSGAPLLHDREGVDGVSQATLFDAETDLNPYVVAYEAATDGAPFVGWQYVIWNSQQWAAWVAETGADPTRPRTPAERDAFGAWLADRWGVST